MSRGSKMNTKLTDQQTTKRHFLGHNFGIVYRFEVARMLKKKSFWLSIIAFPLLMALIFAIAFFSQMSSENIDDELADETFSIYITDDSHLINQAILDQINATNVNDKQTGIDAVRSGQIDAYIYYPSDLVNEKIEVYGQNVGLFENGKYSAVAMSLLEGSAQTEADPNVRAVLAGQVSSDSRYYQNGKEYNMFGDMIIPAAFLILFYLVICIFSGQMLTATVEEKENRITEMLLITIRSRTLIVGKIFAFITLILIQTLVIIGLVLGGYLLVANYLNLPSLDLSIITFDPARIAIAIVLFIISMLMYSGIMVAIGAATPTAKEANAFMSVPVLLLFLPLYAISTVIATPDAPVVLALMFFPFTAPVLLMISNALGTLSVTNALIGITIITITTIIIFIVAARLFQTGAIEYHKRIRLFSGKSARAKM